MQLDGPPSAVEHGDVWWLDAVTRQMVEQRLNLNGMLTFTLRGGRPINLSREQVPPCVSHGRQDSGLRRGHASQWSLVIVWWPKFLLRHSNDRALNSPRAVLQGSSLAAGPHDA